MELVQLKNGSGIGRPPGDGIGAPGEDAVAVSEEQSFNRQIATNRNNFIIGGFRKPQAVIERFHYGNEEFPASVLVGLLFIGVFSMQFAK